MAKGKSPKLLRRAKLTHSQRRGKRITRAKNKSRC